MPGVVESPRIHNEPYQTFGRGSSTNPEMQRLQGLAGGYGDATAMQRASYDQFGQMAAGQGPSLAQSQLQQGMAQAQQAAVQSALNARGGNAAGGQAAALQAATAFGGQAATAAAQLRQQEQLAAMQAQAGMSNQMAQQGLALEGMYQDQLANQLNADVQYRLGSREIRERERAGRSQRIHAAVNATPLGWFGGDLFSDERIKTNIQPSNGLASQVVGNLGNDITLAPYQLSQQPPPQIQPEESGGGLGNILGLVGLLSDERTKRNIAPGNLSASQAVGELDPYTFEYEAGYGDGPGQRIGIMAQDLERVAPQAVADTPMGKMVNAAQGTGLALAASAEQEKRIRDLEAMLGTGDLGGAAKHDEEMRQRPQESARPRQQYAHGGLAGPIPYEDTRAQGREANAQMFDREAVKARQQDADAAKLREREGQPVSDASRRMAMQVGAAPQQRELGPNSLQQIDRNYMHYDNASPQSIASDAAAGARARMQQLEQFQVAPTPAPQHQRDPNWRFVQPAQPMPATGLAAGQPPLDPLASYNPRANDMYLGYGGLA